MCIRDRGYLKRLREICDKHNILLIFDEVITGYGRLGAPFAAQYFDVIPDMIVSAKGLTNGVLPMGAVYVKNHIHDAFMHGPEHLIEFFHGYTYSGHPMACAAALGTLDTYEEEGLLTRASELADYWESSIHSLKGHPHVIDIRNIEELNFIKEEAGQITIGSTTNHSAVASSNLLKEKLPSLSKLAEGIGDPHVRNMGTIGGAISNNDPTADYPAACLGLGATIRTSKRELIADDFFVSLFETALDEDEIVTSVSFPIIKNSSYMKFPNPASRYAMAGVFISKKENEVRVAVTGAGENGVFRWKEMEEALSNDWSRPSAENIKLPPEGVMSDIHGSSEYRANLANIMAVRAFENIK